MLKGQAKVNYQRTYMRRYRMENAQRAKIGLLDPPDVRPDKLDPIVRPDEFVIIGGVRYKKPT